MPYSIAVEIEKFEDERGFFARIWDKEKFLENGINDELLNLKLKGYIQPMLSYNIDHLVLGCTHYYFLKDILSFNFFIN